MSDVPEAQVANREKNLAALTSVLAAVLLTGLKLAVGLLTSSLGILAEAAHSGLDLAAALMTFFAVRIAGRPPDAHHTYGHGKVENLSALFETLLLLATCVWIIYEAIQRLFFRAVEVEASIWGFVVMAISVTVDINRSRMLYRTAQKHKSQALEADALHFATDVWSSSVVILGLGGVWLGERLGPRWAFLIHTDAIAALIVATIVVGVSFQLGKRAVMALVDTAPRGLQERVQQVAEGVPGVEAVTHIRVREVGPAVFLDLTATVDRSKSLEEAHSIASQVEDEVRAAVPGSDVVVHIDPGRAVDETLEQTLSALAAQLGLRLHNMHAHQEAEGIYLDLHAELDERLTLREARGLLAQFEARVREEIPAVREVNTHLEPRHAPVLEDRASAEREVQVEQALRDVLGHVQGVRSWHGLQVRQAADGLDVVVHCTAADPEIDVATAHRLADEVERSLREQVPGLGQVLVHIEEA
ncbi:MAG: cation diffusion facilitator family transporter [Anaerolineae bacterium]